tara:strand:+ start:96 stop:365 length:270 start_codon:yes stop_codon:yes gene_type:complete
MTQTMHYIVHPVRKRILESEIRDQYRDAVANGEAEEGYDDIEDIKAELEDGGKVTFADSFCPNESMEEPIDEGLAYQDRLAGWHGPHHG